MISMFVFAFKTIKPIFSAVKKFFCIQGNFPVKELFHSQGIFPQSRNFSIVKEHFHNQGIFPQ